jgi:hypothetical protein
MAASCSRIYICLNSFITEFWFVSVVHMYNCTSFLSDLFAINEPILWVCLTVPWQNLNILWVCLTVPWQNLNILWVCLTLSWKNWIYWACALNYLDKLEYIVNVPYIILKNLNILWVCRIIFLTNLNILWVCPTVPWQTWIYVFWMCLTLSWQT